MLLPPGYPPPTAERGPPCPPCARPLERPRSAEGEAAAAAAGSRRAGPRRAGVYKLTPGTRAEPHIKGRVPHRLPSLLAIAQPTSPRAARRRGSRGGRGAGRRAAPAADWALSAGRLGTVWPEAPSARVWLGGGRGAAVAARPGHRRAVQRRLPRRLCSALRGRTAAARHAAPRCSERERSPVPAGNPGGLRLAEGFGGHRWATPLPPQPRRAEPVRGPDRWAPMLTRVSSGEGAPVLRGESAGGRAAAARGRQQSAGTDEMTASAAQ